MDFFDLTFIRVKSNLKGDHFVSYSSPSPSAHSLLGDGGEKRERERALFNAMLMIACVKEQKSS
ncbi:hypothetical protein B9G55_10545 [Saccharibacillus sp. O16]|nr:hypothetical protein B9G55_10545 [Saccharibacillus sp. O16]